MLIERHGPVLRRNRWPAELGCVLIRLSSGNDSHEIVPSSEFSRNKDCAVSEAREREAARFNIHGQRGARLFSTSQRSSYARRAYVSHTPVSMYIHTSVFADLSQPRDSRSPLHVSFLARIAKRVWRGLLFLSLSYLFSLSAPLFVVSCTKTWGMCERGRPWPHAAIGRA